MAVGRKPINDARMRAHIMARCSNEERAALHAAAAHDGASSTSRWLIDLGLARARAQAQGPDEVKSNLEATVSDIEAALAYIRELLSGGH